MSRTTRSLSALALLQILAAVGEQPPTLIAPPPVPDRDEQAEAERIAAAEAKRARKAAKRARQFHREPTP